MRLRTLRRTLGGAATTVLLMQAAPQPAGATPSPTVTPNTGLVDGQVVLVEGNGLLPICVRLGDCSSVGLLQCEASIAITIDNWSSHCEVMGSATSAGSAYSGSIPVRRTIQPSQAAAIGCGTVGCVVAAAGVNGGALEFHTAPITFCSSK